MIRIRILYIGKTKEVWLKEALSEYERRLKGAFSVEWEEVRDNEKLKEKVERGAVLLDPKGKMLDSERFSEQFFEWVEEGGSRLSFVIGGAEGLPESLRRGGHPLLSLSPMTFTHQMTRLLLLEQIYRAKEIRAGKPYHK